MKIRNRPQLLSEISPIDEISNQTKRMLMSESSNVVSTENSSCETFSNECDVLQEMFPESYFLEVKHCINIANGDVNRAIQILLHRQETGQSLLNNNTQVQSKGNAIDDTELKNRIIARYSYVDKNASQREYKPIVHKMEPKKLVRYRDNKIVSLKGERFTDVSKQDDDNDLKKSKKNVLP